MKGCLIFIVVLMLALAAPAAFSQSNTFMDELLAEENATYGKTVHLTLAAAGMVPDDGSVEESLEYLAALGWKLKEKDADEAVKLGEYAYLIMMAFDMRGGIFYRLFPGPRYAVRHVAYLGFVRRNPLAYRTVSGEEVVRILGRVLEWEKTGS